MKKKEKMKQCAETTAHASSPVSNSTPSDIHRDLLFPCRFGRGRLSKPKEGWFGGPYPYPLTKWCNSIRQLAIKSQSTLDRWLITQFTLLLLLSQCPHIRRKQMCRKLYLSKSLLHHPSTFLPIDMCRHLRLPVIISPSAFCGYTSPTLLHICDTLITNFRPVLTTQHGNMIKSDTMVITFRWLQATTKPNTFHLRYTLTQMISPTP